MGIKDFTKVFNASGVVSFKNMKNTTLAIDASVELYRASLGMASVNSLTDKNGESTVYLNTLFATIIRYQKHKINQIWVFDHDSECDKSIDFHNPLKIAELAKRKLIKDKAKLAIKEYSNKNDEKYLFSDSEMESDDDTADKAEIKKPQVSLEKLEKRCFSLNSEMVNNLKFMLNCLDIKWMNSPAGYESEHICACLTKQGIADSVLSSDADSLIFGAKSLIKKNIKDKKYYIYYLNKILVQITQSETPGTMQDLIKIGVILGCDFANKTSRIGAKTVLKKYDTVELTDEQKKAVEHFNTQCPIDELNAINNKAKTPFTDVGKARILLDWLEEKSFSRARIKKQLALVIDI